VLINLNEEGEPSFACIDHICVLDDDVFFVIIPWITHEFSPVSRSYSCTRDDRQMCIKSTDVVDYKPFFTTKCSKLGCIYEHIVLRHLLCYDKIFTTNDVSFITEVLNFITLFSLCLFQFEKITATLDMTLCTFCACYNIIIIYY
jgi:hypothetical protein